MLGCRAVLPRRHFLHRTSGGVASECCPTGRTRPAACRRPAVPLRSGPVGQAWLSPSGAFLLELRPWTEGVVGSHNTHPPLTPQLLFKVRPEAPDRGVWLACHSLGHGRRLPGRMSYKRLHHPLSIVLVGPSALAKGQMAGAGHRGAAPAPDQGLVRGKHPTHIWQMLLLPPGG